eukprot:3491866-Pleurochrysis_carterae.AAC.1
MREKEGRARKAADWWSGSRPRGNNRQVPCVDVMPTDGWQAVAEVLGNWGHPAVYATGRSCSGRRKGLLAYGQARGCGSHSRMDARARMAALGFVRASFVSA